MTQIRIALCQLDAVVGDIDGNVEQTLAALKVAEEADADVAVFPELMVTGYPPEDLLLRPAFVDHALRGLDAVVRGTSASRCAAIVGFVDRVAGERGVANAAAVISAGAVRGIWHKEFLPNYGVFDERRWFTPGVGATPLFRIAGVSVAVTICEDAWFADGPIARQAAGGAAIVCSLNASPYRAGAMAEREAMLAERARDARVPIAYVNLVGGQDELVFDGGSMVVDASGAVTCRLPQFSEEVGIVDLDVPDPDGDRSPGSVAPLRVVDVVGEPGRRRGHFPPRVAPAPAVADEVYDALVLATRDYVTKNRFTDVVISLSGGIDSALVAAIAVDALGPGRVHGVLLPSRYSSPGSVSDALELSEALGIEHRTIPIEEVHDAFLTLLGPHFGDRPADLAEENLQARIRGTVVMALSNKFGWLVLTTGNKSELAVGYATLYGDMAGGFAVIRDVPKTLVYAVARARNARRGGPVIPEAILAKPPSAELRPDQLDADSLPPYDVLDPILEAYVERESSVAEIVAAGFDEATVRRVVRLVEGAEYKRRQAPPGARVTSRAFGRDRRMPITNGAPNP